jgi:hypothetical protein
MVATSVDELPTIQHYEYCNFFTYKSDLHRLNTMTTQQLRMTQHAVYAYCAVCVMKLREGGEQASKGWRQSENVFKHLLQPPTVP